MRESVFKVEAVIRILTFSVIALSLTVGTVFGVRRWWTGMDLPAGVNTPEQFQHFKIASWDNFQNFDRLIVPSIVIIFLLTARLPKRKLTPQAIISIAALSIAGLLLFVAKSDPTRWHPFSVPAQPASFPNTPAQPLTSQMTAQQRAVKAFPELGLANSKLNLEFVRRYKIYKVQNPAYFNNSEWPTQLARESQLSLGNQPGSPFAQPELSLPRSGEAQTYSPGMHLAPFEIQSSFGSNYLVKLVDSASGKAAMTIFVSGGNTVKVNVPLGTYTVKYASGNKWYGYHYLFGPHTSFAKASDILSFNREGTKITGYTITLYKVLNGNLHTEPISPSEF